MRREGVVLFVIVLLAVGLRAYNLRHEYFIGNDAFLHYSVLRQALSGGGLSNYALSFGNPLIIEPKGLYYITLLPAYVFGLDFAFLLMPLLSGIVCVLLSYYLIRDYFGVNPALLTAFFLALSIANVYRTSPGTYRGDGFYLTIVVALLYVYNKYLKGGYRQSLLLGSLLGFSCAVWGGSPLGVILVISGLIIDLTIKYLNSEIKFFDLKKALIVLVTYYLIQSFLILADVTKESYFTLNKPLHFAITFAPLVVGLIYQLAPRVSKKRVLSVLVVVVIVLIALNVDVIMSVVSQSLFEQSLFYSVGVSELLPPTFELLTTMLSWTIYLMWPGLLLLVMFVFKKRNAMHSTYLIWVLISVYLMLGYSRYNFLASVAVASLSSLFVFKLVKAVWRANDRIAVALLCLVIVPYSIDSFVNINRVGPRMNDAWFDALSFVRANLTSGMTVTWWDHGSWVQYYDGFPTVVDSITGQDEYRISRIAKFFMTSDYDSFSDFGAKYLILGGDVVLYSDAVLKIAGVNGFEVSGVGSPVTASINNENVVTLPAGDGRFELYANGAVYRSLNGLVPINKTFVNNGVIVSSVSNATGCLVVNQFFNLFFNDFACNSNYVNLMYGPGLPGYELLYDNGYVRVYEITGDSL